MITRSLRCSAALLCAGLLSAPAFAQDEADSTSRLLQGSYIAPMASYIITDDDAFDDGVGGTLAAGYRVGWWAIEASGVFGRYAGGDPLVTTTGLPPLLPVTTTTPARDTDVIGGTINALVFPFAGLPNFFGLIGAGGLNVDRHPQIGREYSMTTVEGGLGYIFPLSWGNYDFGIRADARYRYGDRESRVDPDGDLEIPGTFKDVLLNVGLQLPLGLRPTPPAPPAETVAVVPVLAICADGLDNDGDGLIDFPADPGCTGTDDGDETDPPQCSDGKDNDGDGLVDFPADKGCTGADDNDEVDPCKTPAVGERVSLKGCGLGDVIVLRGVNFEFDKDRLTVNAKTILDNVAEELVAYPEITIELGGHTDAKGSDEYNQALSDRRAASVVRYLKGKDIAAERMSSAGYGEAQPVADNETDEGRELNRRVELKITSGVAPGSTTTSDGSSTTVTEGVSTEPAVEAPAADAPPADAPAADAVPAEAAPAETPVAEETNEPVAP